MKISEAYMVEAGSWIIRCSGEMIVAYSTQEDRRGCLSTETLTVL